MRARERMMGTSRGTSLEPESRTRPEAAGPKDGPTLGLMMKTTEFRRTETLKGQDYVFSSCKSNMTEKILISNLTP